MRPIRCIVYKTYQITRFDRLAYAARARMKARRLLVRRGQTRRQLDTWASRLGPAELAAHRRDQAMAKADALFRQIRRLALAGYRRERMAYSGSRASLDAATANRLAGLRAEIERAVDKARQARDDAISLLLATTPAAE